MSVLHASSAHVTLSLLDASSESVFLASCRAEEFSWMVSGSTLILSLLKVPEWHPRSSWSHPAFPE